MLEAEKKLSEYRTLNNRLRRYWGRLVKESLVIARDQGLVTGVANSDIHIAYDITIKRKGENIDTSQLTYLSSKKFPTLYRKYLEGSEKRNQLRKDLTILLKTI